MHDPVKKARATYESAERRVSETEASCAALTSSRPAADDFEALMKWTERSAALAQRLGVAREVRDAAAAALSSAEAESRRRAVQRQKAELEREAKTVGEKLVRDIAAELGRVASNQERLVNLKARIDDFNRTHGNWFGRIEDPEFRLRRTPGLTTPAAFEIRDVWVEQDGRPYAGVYYTNRAGELVPAEMNARKERRQVQVSAERLVHAVTPESYTALRLPGFMGGEKPLWPGQS